MAIIFSLARCIKYLFAASWLSWSITAAAADTNTIAKEVRDLHYGVVLFQFYQNKYFSAASQLMAAQKKQRLIHHRDDAELLLGGMLLSYGLYQEAETIFRRLIKQAAPAVQNRAWFYLGEIHYKRGHAADAEQALLEIKGELPGDLEMRKHLLLANVLLAQQKYEQAVTELRRFHGNSVWHLYGQFNLGIAYIKSGRLVDGEQELYEIGSLEINDREIKALRDRANLALGYAFLKQKNAEKARFYFERLRLRGPYSNQALFGIGQAYADQAQYESALKYWNELSQRTTYGPAVFESLSAVPAAFFQLKAYKQSLDAYELAVATYKADIERLDDAIRGIQQEHLLNTLLERYSKQAQGYSEVVLPALPTVFKHYYLTEFLSSHEFNELLKNYNDVLFLRQFLDYKLQTIESLQQALTVQRTAFSQKLPQVLDQAQPLLGDTIHQRFNGYAEKLAYAERDRDVEMLASAKEQEWLGKLKQLKNDIDQLAASGQDVTELNEKYRLLNGRVIWLLNSEFGERLLTAKDSLKELQRGMAETQARRQALQAAESALPGKFANDEKVLAQMHERLLQLKKQAATVSENQEAYIQKLAVSKLETYKHKLETYITQANFSIAQIYDLATTEQDATGPPAAPAKSQEEAP